MCPSTPLCHDFREFVCDFWYFFMVWKAFPTWTSSWHCQFSCPAWWQRQQYLIFFMILINANKMVIITIFTPFFSSVNLTKWSWSTDSSVTNNPTLFWQLVVPGSYFSSFLSSFSEPYELISTRIAQKKLRRTKSDASEYFESNMSKCTTSILWFSNTIFALI